MLSPDTILQNRYRIVGKLGQGGMGTVYEAVDQRLQATVALKEAVIINEHVQKQFEKEARLLAGLSHPALPKVYDYFVEGDKQYLVMEFVPGEDLWMMMLTRRAPFPVEEVTRWADQLLDALDYLHTQEPPVIHRDIKPHNLKLSGRGQIKLLDFGLAKGSTGQLSHVSAAQSVFGYTLSYAALEQIQGTGTDPRSDLYSLSSTLYHFLTATIPPDALTRITEVANEKPDPLRPANELNPHVTPALAALLSQAMSQNRDRRPPSAVEMRQSIRLITTSVASSRNTDPETLKLSQDDFQFLSTPISAQAAQTEIMETTASQKSQAAQTDAPAKSLSTKTSTPLQEATLVDNQQANQRVAQQQMFSNVSSKSNWTYTWAAASLFALVFMCGIGAVALNMFNSRNDAVATSNSNKITNGNAPVPTTPTISMPTNSSPNTSQTPVAKNPTPETKPSPKPTEQPTPEPTKTPRTPKTISGGRLDGKAVSLPKPAYPAIARASGASGTVVVQVTVDESGRVSSASAISGHPLLKASAVQAAYAARFTPTLVEGQPVKVTGTISYNFVNDTKKQ